MVIEPATTEIGSKTRSQVELEAADPGFVRNGFERQRSAWTLTGYRIRAGLPKISYSLTRST